METIQPRSCMSCGKPLKGRIDKKFCDDSCRNIYNNHSKLDEHTLVRQVIATNETYKNAKGEKITETQWHNVIAWDKAAEIAEKYFTKGLEVLIEGKLVRRSYTDKDGIKRYSTEVQASDMLILTKK